MRKSNDLSLFPDGNKILFRSAYKNDSIFLKYSSPLKTNSDSQLGIALRSKTLCAKFLFIMQSCIFPSKISNPKIIQSRFAFDFESGSKACVQTL